MKTLFLIRHAKSSWKNALLVDQDRPLNKRGERDAPQMGQRLANRQARPDLVISSPALRAYETAVRIADEIGYAEDDIQTSKELYLQGKSGIMDVLSGINPEISCVMLFAHNPGVTIAANYLANADIDHIPTCGVAEIQFDVEFWTDVEGGTGKLILFDYPKRLENQEDFGHQTIQSEV